MRGKRGQDTANAATLVALIAGLIILYLTFLPDAERDKLLDDTSLERAKVIIPGVKTNDTLLLEKPGRLEFVNDDKIIHEIPSITLFKTTSAREIKTENPFSVRNGWFDKQGKNFTFELSEMENVENVVLTFNTQKRQGRLSIIVNGNVVFDSSLESSNVVPITLDKRILQDFNQVEFAVSGVGLAFWTTDEYTITNLKVVADVTDLSRQEGKNIFTLTETEKLNLESAMLKFTPNCNFGSVGPLIVKVNTFDVYSSVPECRILNRIELPVSLLDAGENRLSFKTTEGSYLIDQITVETRLKEKPTAVYYFEVSRDQFLQIENLTKEVNLSMDFVRRNDTKRATLSVNGHLTSVNTNDREFSRILPRQWISRGSNYLEIEPRTTLDVFELRIELQKINRTNS